MKKAVTALSLTLLLMGNALAVEIPTATTAQNLNGSQQYIKTYTVAPDVDPQTLIEDSFVYEGYAYDYAAMVKTEHHSDEKKLHTETVTIETPKNDLALILAELAPTIDYSTGGYSGTLALDHTTINTKAAGYANKSYTVSETKEIANLSSNDMSFVPATTIKNGVTLNLAGVDWQVQGTAMVDDTLVPSLYKAVATYSNQASYRSATGYITTANYEGEITRSGVDGVTYTVTYLGTENRPEAPTNAMTVLTSPWLIGGCGLVITIVLAVLLFLSRRQIRALKTTVNPQDAEYEEVEEIAE